MLLASSSAYRSCLLLPTLLPSPKRDIRRESDSQTTLLSSKDGTQEGCLDGSAVLDTTKTLILGKTEDKGEGGSRGPMVR